MTTQPDPSAIAVIKIGGSTLGANDTSLRDIAAARREGRQIVVVHGGGAAVTAWLDALGIRAAFERGLRVTDARTLDVVVSVLAGLVNKQLVADLCALGAPAIGISGADAMILQARSAALSLQTPGFPLFSMASWRPKPAHTATPEVPSRSRFSSCSRKTRERV